MTRDEFRLSVAYLLGSLAIAATDGYALGAVVGLVFSQLRREQTVEPTWPADLPVARIRRPMAPGGHLVTTTKGRLCTACARDARSPARTPMTPMIEKSTEEQIAHVVLRHGAHESDAPRGALAVEA